MPSMFVEAPVTPGFSLSDAAQYLIRELDREASRRGRVVSGNVTIFEGVGGFGEQVLRIEAPVR